MKAKAYSALAGLGKLSREELKERNLELYGRKIKKYRTRAGLTAEELADKLQLSKSTVRNWECGLTRPELDLLYALFEILDIEPNEFFGIKGIGHILTPDEKNLIDDYRFLDDSAKEDLRTFADAMRKKSYLRKLRAAYEKMNDVPDMGRHAAAGPGEDWPEHIEAEQIILYNSHQVAEADEIITVSGDSMEPQFHNHDKVLVHYCTQIRNGDIGIFYVPGRGGVIKQKLQDRLHSINPEYDDIFPYEDGADVIGKVIGKVERYMVPGVAEQELYIEALKEPAVTDVQ